MGSYVPRPTGEGNVDFDAIDQRGDLVIGLLATGSRCA